MTTPWTCPFCPLACDHLGVRVGGEGQALALVGADCTLAREALARFASRPQPASASVDGVPATTETAVATAARWLAASTQTLIAGIGTDVAGARALYPLACTLGAVCDAAGGDALIQGLRALQDRGQFTTTLAEVRTRADLIVFVGGLPVAMAPLIADRCGLGDPQVPARRVVILGGADDDAAHAAAWASRAGVTVESIALHGDLFDTLALLQALVAGRALPPGVAPAALASLAARLHAAAYAVFVGAPARLPAHGSLLIEGVHQVVELLNRKSRAAALWIGGGHGAATANQVFTWLSGLPMRTRIGARGLEHDPLLNGAGALLADGAVDTLLWVSSFAADALPPPAAQGLPTVVLGPPAQAAACRRAGVIFIPIATPGIGTAGHVFRTDGTVLMPLHAVRADGLPGVDEVAASLHAAVCAERERAAS